MRSFTARSALVALAVALLALALMASTAMAGPGNGNGNGHGHGKPAEAGVSRGKGHESKPEKKAKHEKKVKSDTRSEEDEDGAGDDEQESLTEPAKQGGRLNFLAALACKDGGWQSLQRVDGTTFENQGRCVSYAVQDGVLAPVVPEGAEEDDAAPEEQGGSNFLAALACKDGGWQALQRADGTRFDNQGRCVSYAVRGGIVAAIVPVVTISFVPSATDGFCDATATLGDFDPSTVYSATWTASDATGGVVAITTDALGDASAPLGTFATDLVLEVTVNDVSSGEITVACPPIVAPPEG
jgi:hypothetical protein